MSGIFIAASGVLICGLAIYDFLTTTLSLNGLGPISRVLTRQSWRAGRSGTLWMERRLHVSARGLIGPVILSVLAAGWIILHLAGYTLLYLSGSSLELSRTQEPANFIQTVAFAGSALSTLGASTVTPTNGWWDALSMVAALNGMVVLTLSVSYVLSILQTTSSARNWAVQYHTLMECTEEREADPKPDAVTSLGRDLCEVVVDLTASPLTGVFVPNDAKMSFPHAVGELCDHLDQGDLASWRKSVSASERATLRAGVDLLGRHAGARGYENAFEAARHWTRQHSLPPRDHP